MKKLTLLFLGVFWGYAGFSQTLTPEVYATSGDYFSNSNNSLSWTLGESFIETYSSANNNLTQGFQQSTYFITSVTGNMKDASIAVYPNPASSFVNICSESIGIKKMRADLFDIQGKLIHSEIFQNTLQLNLIGYTDSEYLIHVYDENNNSVKTFKLLKTN